jgi:hypothetical protein
MVECGVYNLNLAKIILIFLLQITDYGEYNDTTG